jgi:hypothetical protein
MFIIDLSTTVAIGEDDVFMRGVFAFRTEDKIFLSIDANLVDESFANMFIDDSVECR